MRIRAPMAALTLASILACPAFANEVREETVHFYGDSLLRGNDDEPTPEDNDCSGTGNCYEYSSLSPASTFCANPGAFCSSGPSVNFAVSYAAALGFEKVVRHAQGGWDTIDITTAPPNTPYGLFGMFYQRAMHLFPSTTVIVTSLHVNDCGSEAAADVRSRVKEYVDHMKSRTNATLLFFRSPGSVGKQFIGGGTAACDTALFDGGADSLRDLFLGTGGGEYGNDPRVYYTEELYRYFNAADRKLWWYFADSSSTGSAYVHPNGQGYSVMAWLLAEWLAAARQVDAFNGDPLDPGDLWAPINSDWALSTPRLNNRPPAPSFSYVSGQPSPPQLTINVTVPTDADGDPVSVYVFAAPTDRDPGAVDASDYTTQTTGDACIRTGCLADVGDSLPSDFTSTAEYIRDVWKATSSGNLTIALPGTSSYSIVAYAFDGKVVSDPTIVELGHDGVPPVASFGPCTDGVDCLCDQPGYIEGQAAISGGGTVRYCQDFDDLTWDDDTGDAAYLAGFSEAASFNCPSDKGAQGAVDEGTDDDDCFDMVQEPDCGLAGTSDCAFGNQSFGNRYVQGHTHGIVAKPGWAGLSEYGITMAIRWSENFEFNSTAGFKTVELIHGDSGNTNGYPFGQGISMGVGSFSPEKYPAGYAAEATVSGNQEPRGFATRTNFTGACSSGELDSVVITKGLIACDGGLTYWTAFETDYEDNDGTFPVGRWGCMRCHMTGIGTSNMGLQCWWKDETDAAESEIINFTGYDSTTAELGNPLTGITFNSYFNGVQTEDCTDGLTEANSGGYGSTGCSAPNFTYSPTADVAYRYEDNLVITDGAPVSCAEIGI